MVVPEWKGIFMPPIDSFVDRVVQNVEQVIVGKRESIKYPVAALLCEGHLLIEDDPGVGKPMLARSLAVSLGGQFRRLPCTPDLIPNDVTGVSIFNHKSAPFEFRPGPVFVNILLADVINRATRAPVRVVGGDAGAAGDGRWIDPSPPASVPRPGDPESDRV
jgi:MoxR-like ATPase